MKLEIYKARKKDSLKTIELDGKDYLKLYREDGSWLCDYKYDALIKLLEDKFKEDEVAHWQTIFQEIHDDARKRNVGPEEFDREYWKKRMLNNE